jgi:hypothetical protein
MPLNSPLTRRFRREDIEQFFLNTIGREKDAQQIVGIYRLIDIAEPAWIIRTRATSYVVYVRQGMLALCRMDAL